MKTKKVRLGDLMFDEELLKLRPINNYYVGQYRRAYQAGETLPQIIIEEITQTITSGNHRARAMLLEYGPDHLIKASVKNYESKKERLLDFIQENSKHGFALDGKTKKLLVVEARSLGASVEELALAFGCPITSIIWLENYQIPVVAIGENKVTMHPVKRVIPRDQEITTEQYKEHMEKDLGVSIGQLAWQITRWVRNGWIREKDMDALTVLKTALDEFFMDKAM